MIVEDLRLGTWNLCLGLPNKKDYVTHTLEKNNLSVCCLQECEVPINLDEHTLSAKNFKLELEENDYKKRTGIYINNSVHYERRKDLEEKNNNIVVIDIKLQIKYRIINIYRSFSSNDNRTPTERFQKQLSLIETMLTDRTFTPIIIGDFNLDFKKSYDPFYGHHLLYELLHSTFEPLGLIQLIKFETWARFVNGTKRSSTIDHIYTNDPFKITNIKANETEIGDHLLITCKIMGTTNPPKPVMRRDWRFYSKEILVNMLSKTINTQLKPNTVQCTWNYFENQMINTIDELVPLTPFINDQIKNKVDCPQFRNLLNRKKRLLKHKKANDSLDIHLKLKAISKEIRQFIKINKSNNIRRGIIPGNSKSLWTAVKKAKDQNTSHLPNDLTHNNMPIHAHDTADSFATFFKNKVQSIISECSVDNNVYNGIRKVNCENQNFMTPENVLTAINSLKSKNCEGFDRIPLRALIDSTPITLPILTHLFNLIYEQKIIPEQWKISRIIPIPKPGDPHKIENYRPISNLCSTSKIFEKLILKRLTQIETENNCSLTGKSQHGFKKAHSTCSLGLTVQSVLTHALDENNYALMASLDLSAAFDVVNVKLLLKRLKVIGLPKDVIKLIEIWLEQRHFYVDIEGSVSELTESNAGTVQGSILGPILYAIFVSPVFDLEKMSNYADDNYVIRWNSKIDVLIVDMKKSLEAITKWLRDSGLKVNESKTEICMFHRNDSHSIEIELNGITLKSTPQIKVLGVIFDSGLKWTQQITNTVRKAKMALNAIKLIKKYFSPTEIRTLLTANFFSILYYNSEIWHLPTLNPKLKQTLLSASANALKLCLTNYDQMTSFMQIHSLARRASPDKYCTYKHALLLHKIYNSHTPKLEWTALNFNQNFNTRNPYFRAFSRNNYKIGKNKISERLIILNNKIKLEHLNRTFDSFKIQCKQMFLSF